MKDGVLELKDGVLERIHHLSAYRLSWVIGGYGGYGGAISVEKTNLPPMNHLFRRWINKKYQNKNEYTNFRARELSNKRWLLQKM